MLGYADVVVVVGKSDLDVLVGNKRVVVLSSSTVVDVQWSYAVVVEVVVVPP